MFFEKMKNKFVKKSYSQCGEDRIVSMIFAVLKMKNIFYIDIGANHPFAFNNTALFYEEGSHGINIEPNYEMYSLLRKHRKRDINLNIGVSTAQGELPYYIMDAHTLNTFSTEEALALEKKWGRKIINKVQLPVDTYANIISRYADSRQLDFLNIDAEGVDMMILRQIDYARACPKVICIETVEYTETGIPNKNSECQTFLEGHGYFLFADTHINSIFVLKDLWASR